MKKLKIIQVDAFTTRPLGGNPCAVVLEADGLSEKTMQDIALEMNLSETAFVMSSDVADFRARYFTPSEEIPLAGHPTIATVHTLIVKGLVSYQAKKEIRLQLEAGVITVEVSDTPSGHPRITMSQLRPQFLRVYDPPEVLPAFGLDSADGLDGAPIMTVSTGTPQLMVPLKSLEALQKAHPVIDRLVELSSSGDFFSTHLFILQGITERGATFARHFALPPDTLEDPFTGSATGGMGAYLWHHQLIDSPSFLAEQGHLMGRPGEAFVEVIGPRDSIETVKVGGFAVEVMSGELQLPEMSDAG
jgi:trans-2,3-dihydro-3-hydroxyanthranilate isomerase